MLKHSLSFLFQHFGRYFSFFVVFSSLPSLYYNYLYVIYAVAKISSVHTVRKSINYLSIISYDKYCNSFLIQRGVNLNMNFHKEIYNAPVLLLYPFPSLFRVVPINQHKMLSTVKRI